MYLIQFNKINTRKKNDPLKQLIVLPILLLYNNIVVNANYIKIKNIYECVYVYK